jgi:hypothetical protein
VQSGKTPLTVPLSASAGYFEPARYRVEVFKPGYAPTVSHINAHLNSWYGGNLIFGWFPGWLVVDPVSGAMWTLKTSHYSHLDEVPRRVSQKTKPVKVVSLDEIPLHQRSQLVRVN